MGMWHSPQPDGSWLFKTGKMRIEDDCEIPFTPITRDLALSKMDAAWEILNQQPEASSVLRIQSLDISTVSPLFGVPYEEWRLKDLRVAIQQRMRTATSGSSRWRRLRDGLKAKKGKGRKEFAKVLRDDDSIESGTQPFSLLRWLSKTNTNTTK